MNTEPDWVGLSKYFRNRNILTYDFHWESATASKFVIGLLEMIVKVSIGFIMNLFIGGNSNLITRLIRTMISTKLMDHI
jgi:hypothetical protein